ncbi:MAG: chromate resistance protein [Burkholderiaceae bacterium]
MSSSGQALHAGAAGQIMFEVAILQTRAMTQDISTWLLLIASLPTSSATPRMRLWRAINALGAMSLRDGTYLLPDVGDHAAALTRLAEQTILENGQAWVVSVAPRSTEDHSAFQKLFERTAAYTAIVAELQEERRSLASLAPSEIAKLNKRLHKDLEAIQRIDFFPNEASMTACAAWSDFQDAVNAVLSPDEPHPAQRQIALLDPREYQCRTWATRRHLWVDRVASAWLIRRFIDHDAGFAWLNTPADCPHDALGFDFDGAAFTHVGDKVTFEVLMASFDLEDDSGLAKIASLVHCLDVGGPSSPESAGFEAILSGARTRLPDDDALLDNIGAVLDSLYSHYQAGASA